MSTLLSVPPGQPDTAAATVIQAITDYMAGTRDPLATVQGVRHIAYWADLAIDDAIRAARDTTPQFTLDAIAAAAGMSLGAVQGRVKRNPERRRRAGESHGMEEDKRHHRLVAPNLLAGSRRCRACHTARNAIQRAGGEGDLDALAEAHYHRIMGLELTVKDQELLGITASEQWPVGTVKPTPSTPG
ncbi:MAG: hypothetical protein ACRDRO_21500 [Pseudonocardiaceae bacterium]